MLPTAVVSFLLLAVPTLFTPGPNNIMLMTSAATFGVRRTLPHAAGIVIGFPTMVLMVGLGVGQLFVAFPWLSTALRYAAVVYFLWMAWNLIGIRMARGTASGRPMRCYEAALFQWINPKAWAMATSYVGALMVDGEGRLASLVWITGGVLALAPFSCLVWVLFGQQLARVLTRGNMEKVLGAILAGLMIAAAVLVFLEP